MTAWTRREFGKSAAAAWIGTAVGGARVFGANDKVRVGFIGVGNRGDQVLDAFLAQPDMEVVAVCDLNARYMDFAVAKSGGRAVQVKDYRHVLDRKDVDAVAINTPDHWHALQMIHACEAGKDVYVEKPLSLVVAEGRSMVAAATKFDRVVQVGLQRRSSPLIREAVEQVRAGAIGKVTVVRAFHVQNEWPHGIGAPADAPAPAGLDWEAWLGPAPLKPYNANRAFYRFRWFYDYSGGQLTNFGVHYLDVIQWALGHDAPLAVTAMGGKFAIEDNREIPDTLEVLWHYPGGTLVTFSQFNANGAPAGLNRAEIEFRGTKGTLYLRSNGYDIVPETIVPRAFPARTPIDREHERGYRVGSAPAIEPSAVKRDSATETAPHARNFLDCVRSRARCHCDIETGHRSSSATFIANVALRSRAYLEWDGRREQFTNNAKANAALSYRYRSPYTLPQHAAPARSSQL